MPSVGEQLSSLAMMREKYGWLARQNNQVVCMLLKNNMTGHSCLVFFSEERAMEGDLAVAHCLVHCISS